METIPCLFVIILEFKDFSKEALAAIFALACSSINHMSDSSKLRYLRYWGYSKENALIAIKHAPRLLELIDNYKKSCLVEASKFPALVYN